MKKLNLADTIRNIPDFPKPGILFRDITTLLQNKLAFKQAVDELSGKFKNKKIDYIVAVEARGFILGAAIAYKLGLGFILVRKKGKLPWRTKSVTYALEYGTDTLEIHEDALKPGDKVLIIDDLLATGGTVRAVVDLVEAQKATIAAIAFVIELVDLKGREKLKGYPLVSLIKFDGE
ncbi:MAG: adenine phosphoribosyltransferase [Candidatus Omnitrophota bacterium]